MSDSTRHYYLCVYLRNGKPFAHQTRSDKSFPENLEVAEKEAESVDADASKMSAIFEQFINTMMGYLEYVPLILTLMPVVSHHMVTAALQNFFEKSSVEIEKFDNRIIYTFRREQMPAIERFEQNLAAASSTSRALPRLLTVGLVTSLEYQVNLIMREIAARFPDAIFGKDKTVAVRDLVKFDSINDLKEFVVADELDKVQRENFEYQIKWIIQKVGMDDFTPHYDGWQKILELFERRNLFIHANGIINEHYIRARDKYKFVEAKQSKIGDELHAGPKYFNQAVQVVFHFGAMLLQVVWRKISPEDSEAADKSISDLGYELIARGQYKLAIKILEFTRNLRGISSELRKRMNLVNLANAYKLSGDDESALGVISSMDWTAVSQEFTVSIAAVKGEIDEVIRIMTRMGKQGRLSAQDYQEWPVFYGIRDDVKFTEAFKNVFGFDYVPSSKRQAGLAQVLEWARLHQQADAAGQDTPELVDPTITTQPEA